MKLLAGIAEELGAAISSAERLRGSPVHGDTLQLWRDLLGQARAEKRNLAADEAAVIEPLIGHLQCQLTAREQHF